MCELTLLVGGGVFLVWLFRQFKRPVEPPAPPPVSLPSTRPWPLQRPYVAPDDDSPFTPRYRSPLGLVDNPDDEWVEWAIMEDLLDGPDEGLFR